MVVETKEVVCDCGSCSCKVDMSDAIFSEGKYYCCQNCANGHINGDSCKHDGCKCGG